MFGAVALRGCVLSWWWCGLRLSIPTAHGWCELLRKGGWQVASIQARSNKCPGPPKFQVRGLRKGVRSFPPPPSVSRTPSQCGSHTLSPHVLREIGGRSLCACCVSYHQQRGVWLTESWLTNCMTTVPLLPFAPHPPSSPPQLSFSPTSPLPQHPRASSGAKRRPERPPRASPSWRRR